MAPGISFFDALPKPRTKPFWLGDKGRSHRFRRAACEKQSELTLSQLWNISTN
jgi:hypothetical protein